MLSPYKIRWHNMSSLEMDLWTEISFDDGEGESETYLSREAVVSESYNGAIRRSHGYKWGEVLTFTVTFIKQNYEEFTEQENRRILKWLTGVTYASFVDVYRDDSEVISWSALGNWVNVSQYKLANGRIAGYVARFEATTPWALSPLKTVTKNISEPSDNVITINLETDEPESAVYPRVTIKPTGLVVKIDDGLNEHSDMMYNTVYYNGTYYYWRPSVSEQRSDTTKPDFEWKVVEVDHPYTDSDKWEDNTIYYYKGTNKYYWLEYYAFHEELGKPNLTTTGVLLTNTHTDYFNKSQTLPSTEIINNALGEEIILDGANRVVSSSRETRIFGDDFVGWTWLPLYDGLNEITVVGNCEVTLEYRYPIKCGEF